MSCLLSHRAAGGWGGVGRGVRFWNQGPNWNAGCIQSSREEQQGHSSRDQVRVSHSQGRPALSLVLPGGRESGATFRASSHATAISLPLNSPIAYAIGLTSHINNLGIRSERHGLERAARNRKVGVRSCKKCAPLSY